MAKSNGRGRGLADIEVDVGKEEEGEWFALDGPCEGISVKLRSPFCEDFQRLQGLLQQRGKVFTATGDADISKIDHVQREAIGACLLVGWRGDEERWAGLEKWTPELAKAVMVEHRYRKLGVRIAVLVRRLGNDEEIARAEEGKGSAPPSVTALT